VTSADDPGGPARALTGLRVVEVCDGIGGGYAGKLLFELGAEVNKVEGPDGDPLRRSRASAGAREGALFDYLNAGKRGLCLDLTAPAGRAALASAVDDAHIVLLDDPTLGDLVPVAAPARGRALVTVTDFGGRGPYEGRPTTDLTLQALSGWVSPRGRVDVPPVQVGLRAHQYVVGVQIACAALTALRTSRITGRRVTATVSRMEAVFNTVAYDMLRRETLLELGYQHRWTAYIPGLMQCADGYVAVNCLTGQHWQDMCAVLDVMDLADSYVQMRFDGTGLVEFYQRIQPWFDQHGAQEVLELFQAFRVPAAPVGDGASMPGFEQYRERGFFRRSTDGLTVPGPPFSLSGSPSQPQRPAPSHELRAGGAR
jgi:crotonobetainyl-CoA:carnitine CoA-transferase CaiB-like acyl-CoA transferase